MTRVAGARGVRVRILVAVDDKGQWASAGYELKGDTNDPREWIAIDDLTEVMRYHWIEADVPLPESGDTIVGEVVEEAP